MPAMTPRDFAAYLQSLPARLIDEVAKAERETVTDAQAEAVRMSSGTLTTKDLRAMGHPYARRAPQTPIDPAIINDQGGDFREGWQKKPQLITSQKIVSGVENATPEAAFMDGTPLMVERPIVAAVQDAVEGRRRTRLHRAVQKALKP